LGFVIHPRLEIFESGCGTWKRRDENQSSIVATIGIASRREKMFSFLFVSCSMLLTCGFEKVIGMVDKVFDKRFCLAFALAWHRLGMSRASYGAQVAALRQFDAARKGTVREHLMIFFFFLVFQKGLVLQRGFDVCRTCNFLCRCGRKRFVRKGRAGSGKTSSRWK
jgi:hypothetical protein